MRLKFEPIDVCEVYFYFVSTIIALKKKQGRIIILVHICECGLEDRGCQHHLKKYKVRIRC